MGKVLPIQFLEVILMSNSTLVMIIYNGRNDPEETLSMWGFDGSDIEDITDVKYQLGSLALHFKNQGYLNNAQNLTKWQAVENDSLCHVLNVDFYNKHFRSEFLVTNKPEKTVAYYGHFYIRPNDEYSLMKLTLIPKNTKQDIATANSLVIENIVELHCNHGNFSIILDTYDDYMKVKQLTNWQDFQGLFSIQIPISNLSNQVMIHSDDISKTIPLQNSDSIFCKDKVVNYVFDLYQSFELSLI